MKMGRALFVLCVLIIMLSSVALVQARKGVGIKWDVNSLIVKEGEQVCVDYGIYNPWDEDVSIKLELSPELSAIAGNAFADPRLVKAGTSSKNATPVKLCFQAGDAVYEKECVIGSFLCAKRCDGPEKTYEGEVIAVEDKSASAQGSFGSSTSIGVSTKLSLKVACQPYDRDWTVVFAVTFTIAILIIAYVLYKRRLSNNSDDADDES